MSDRDPDTGEFSASTEGLYGQQALEAEAGYKPMTLANPVKDAPDDFSVSEAEAADAYASAGEESPIVPIEYLDVGTGEPRDPRETVSLEQASHDLSAYYEAQEDSRAASISADLAAEVELLRALDAKVVEGDDVGELSTEPDAAAEARKASVEKVVKQVVDEATWDGTGLDPEVERALQRPQVRQAIESELTKAAEIQQSYSTGLETAHAFARATFLQNFPELASLPIEHLQQGLVNLAQTNPQRFQAAAATLQRVNQVQQEQAAQQQRQQAVATQQFSEWSKQSDTAFENLPGVDHDTAHRAAIGKEMVSYFSDLGVSQQQLMHEYRTNPMMRSVAGQKALYDLMESRLSAKKAGDWKSKSAPRTVPTVQKPGIAGTARQADPHAALEARFNRSGSLKDAQALYIARSRKG